MLLYAEVSDGLGLEDTLADRGAMVCQTPVAVVAAEQQMNVQQAVAEYVDNDSVSMTSNRLEEDGTAYDQLGESSI